MTDAIIVALLSLTGTLIGSVAGILTANRLTNYRICELEKKVDKHNTLIERTYALERRCEIYDEKFKVTGRRIEDLEKNR